jgi:hypothetical protein
MRVLLLGKRPVLEPGDKLEIAGVDFETGSSLEELHAAFAHGTFDHVIVGGGLPLDVRLELVRAVFEQSDAITVHMKDRASGPHGYVPFIRAVVAGLASR